MRYLDNEELLRAATRISRALTPGGVFFMLDVHPDRYAVSDGWDRYYREGWRMVDVPWDNSQEDYFYRPIETYERILTGAGLRITGHDMCPIVPEGRTAAFAKEFAGYSTTPARFALTATV